jgi:hypothetical protein
MILLPSVTGLRMTGVPSKVAASVDTTDKKT